MKNVELFNVSKSYEKQKEVISDISVSIEPGEFFVLVGPSGCGKSTILRMIAGLEDITKGSLRIDGNEVNLLPPSKRDISMVFQNYALYPHLNVEENIVFGLDVKKVKKFERKERCMEVAEMLGLTDYLKRKPRHLSGGQRQRVALARAIVNQAPICLMDEPLSNLDAKLRAHMRSEIRQIQRKLKITMIYVTHDQVEAMTMGDRIMILNEGKIQQVGKPIDVYNAPANPFVAQFIGSPPMNLATANINLSKQELSIGGRLKLSIPSNDLQSYQEDTVTLGIRPEYLKIVNSINTKSTNNYLDVKVEHVEVLGNETIVSFQLDTYRWQAKWNGQWNVDVGDIVPIAINYESICLFNSASGHLIKGPTQVENHIIHEVTV
ncbi:ABC transporter ATP-binding protein [Aquibacillus kalidii]|uniref:ABC transporter ATP-binding protein n=1 Tax=Aquibacillus kalidii TaxID=2762597 RepID=UPI001647CF22|nr:ABC transporter ATP-binding protein [Aquibacillus kalidii]